ncbi:predicted protein [Phaeodactylum tricornutum CCAP 1055/1]|uniref:Uncharacterized protein n=1 Tax=Phaeodactylum tricornutum (strain CCAP 1055/1) TaxID=556484 RepID=B7GCJ5_PHATC|nr:predicted protein [Phaeodactylum tricornutum CCAP 1055/1]EEC43620.1 predicted protein [Phaeodactylum tricornutum CCAP 1055/1]|eukprot:XP_002184884.1 predicted protein [Phaeodactylum tricornutum CCAP 1055/1]
MYETLRRTDRNRAKRTSCPPVLFTFDVNGANGGAGKSSVQLPVRKTKTKLTTKRSACARRKSSSSEKPQKVHSPPKSDRAASHARSYLRQPVERRCSRSRNLLKTYPSFADAERSCGLSHGILTKQFSSNGVRGEVRCQGYLWIRLPVTPFKCVEVINAGTQKVIRTLETRLIAAMDAGVLPSTISAWIKSGKEVNGKIYRYVDQVQTPNESTTELFPHTEPDLQQDAVTAGGRFIDLLNASTGEKKSFSSFTAAERAMGWARGSVSRKVIMSSQPINGMEWRLPRENLQSRNFAHSARGRARSTSSMDRHTSRAFTIPEPLVFGSLRAAPENRTHQSGVEEIDVRSGRVLKQFDSAEEAEIARGLRPTSVRDALSRSSPLAGGSFWRRVLDTQGPCRGLNANGMSVAKILVPVEQLEIRFDVDLVLGTYNSIEAAEMDQDVNPTTIRDALSREYPLANGFFWRRFGERRTPASCRKTQSTGIAVPVEQLDLCASNDYRVLRSFQSVEEAEEELGLAPTTIRDALQRKKPLAAGFFWRRHGETRSPEQMVTTLLARTQNGLLQEGNTPRSFSVRKATARKSPGGMAPEQCVS